MSYAIVRNEKLTRAEVNGKCTHNDRKVKNHTNKDIDSTRTHLNYYIKKNDYTYTKEFDKKVVLNREQIIKPKDKLIKQLYNENVSLHKELSKQATTVEIATKYESVEEIIFNELIYV